MPYTYKQLSNPSTNLIALLEVMNADGVQDALYKGSEPFEVLAAKAITNAYGAIDDNNIQTLLDSISSTQGAVLYRSASSWSALAPGTSGQALTTGGAGANPSWSTISGALPSQTGNSGKLLTTDGTNASWTTDGILTSLTGPTTTNLTLSGGSSGASLVLGQGTNGAIALTSAGTGNVVLASTSGNVTTARPLLVTNTTAATNTTSGALQVAGGGSLQGALFVGSATNYLALGTNAGVIQSYRTAADGSVRLTRAGVRDWDLNGGSSFSIIPDSGSSVFTLSSAGVLNLPATTSASSSTVGALTIGNGTAATNVAIGGGHVVAGGVVRTGAYTVATLPSAATYPGGMTYVTDANATTRLSTVAGGGANRIMVYSDGTNWLIT